VTYKCVNTFEVQFYHERYHDDTANTKAIYEQVIEMIFVLALSMFMADLQCGLACHKKCLETLAIQCGHKRLPRKMTTFGVDLGQHLIETATLVPHIVCKCIDEIDSRGRLIKVRNNPPLIIFIFIHHSINPLWVLTHWM
jgi:hypothetical protein